MTYTKPKHNKKVPSIAVLLSAFNGIRWIESQIKTILAQKNVSIEIFISIDISIDKTYELCCLLSKKNKNITLLPYGKRFGGAAKNFYRLIRDVDISKFDYIALSDQDDIWDKNKMYQASRIIEKNNLGGYSSDITAFWANGRKKIEKKSFPQKKYDYYFESAGPGCTYVLKKQQMLEFKKFLIKNWKRVNLIELHDWIIYAFFRSQNFKWIIDNKPLMYYRQHRFNQFGLNSGYKAYFYRLKKIKSKWYFGEVCKITNLLNIISPNKFSLNRNFLIKNFWNLRRRPRDTIILLFLNIFYIF
jgi:rhamnosyltransferase